MNKIEISQMVQDLSEGKIVISSDDFGKELNLLGVDSVLLLSLIVAIEDRYNYEWSEDVDDSIFESVDTISDYLGQELQVA